MQSKSLNLSSYSNAKLSFRVQAGGSNNGPESSEDLIVDYRKSNGSWANLTTIDQSNVSHSTFSTITKTLPAAALHSSMRFRIYAMGLDYDTIGSCGSIFGCFKLPADYWFVDNVSLTGSRPPTVSTTIPSTGKDSKDHTLSWLVSDPDNDSISSVSTQLLRGSTLVRSSTTKNGSLKVLKSDGPGTYKLKVTAKDSTGAQRVHTSSNLVLSDDDTKAPMITLGGSSGTEIAADDQQFTWSIVDNLSDSTSSVEITKNSEVIFARDYTSDVISDSFDFNAYGVGTFTISITATDQDNDRSNDDAGPSTADRTVNVVNGEPNASMQVLFTEGVFEGDLIFFDASGSSDPEGDALQFVWNFGDRTLGKGVTATHRYADDGVYEVALTVVDTFGGISTASQSLTIHNAAPSLTASSLLEVAEAAPLLLNLDSDDPGADTTSYLVDWGDGSSDLYADGGDKQHVYADGGLQHTLRVSLSDEDGLYLDQYVTPVNVIDAAPIVSGLPDFVSAQAAQPIDWNVSVTDGISDSHEYTWDFGDSTVLSGSGLGSVQHAYANDGPNSLTLTVTDSDGLSTQQSATVVIGAPVSFVSASQSVSEGGGPVMVEAELANGIRLDHDVTLTLAIQGDVSTADYDLASTQLTIPQGKLSGSVSIDVFDDLLDENDEQLRVTMAATSGASRGAIAEHVIEILDDDTPPTVYFTSPSGSIDESIGTTSLTAELSRISGRDVIVPIAFSGTASGGSDYSLDGPATLVIPAGQTSGERLLAIHDDSSIEKAETIVAMMLPSEQAELSTQTGQTTVVSTIIAANDAPDVSLDSAYRVTTEDVSTFFITARLSRFTDERIAVPLAISGTAQDGVDYRIVKALLEFQPGASAASIQINVIDDPIAEGVETLVVELLSADNANLGTNQLTVTDILDNDIARVSFKTGNVSQFEGHTVPITLSLSKKSASDVVVPLILSGSASLNSDYSIDSQTLRIPAGIQEKSFDITLLDDTRNEAPETLFLQISGETTGALLGDAVSRMITIKDTDPLVSLITPSATNYVEQNLSVTFGVELSALTDEAITVPIKYSGTAKRGSDFNGPTSISIPKGKKSQSFSVSLIDDTVAESTEKVSVVLGTPSAGILANPKKASLSIDDNDAPVTVYWKTRSRSSDEASGAQTFTIGLTRPATQDVTVNLAYTSTGKTVTYSQSILGRTYKFSFVTGRADVGTDYEAKVKSVVIPKGQTSASFEVPVIDDYVKESAEIIKIQMRSASNAVLPVDSSLRQASMTITDVDLLTSAEALAMNENLAQRDPKDLLGLDVQPHFAANFDNQRAQEDTLGALLFAIEEGTKFIPGPSGCITQGVAHAVKWTQEQYPHGTELDYGRLKEDMRKGIYWKTLTRELAIFYAKGAAWAAATGGSTCEEPPGFAWLKELGFAALEAYSDSYPFTKQGAEQLGDDYTKFHKANDDGYVALKESVGGGVAYYKENPPKFSLGSVNGGTIFFDTDYNGLQSDLEPFGSTSSDGRAVIKNLEYGDVNRDGELGVDEGQWVAIGGIDTSVNQPVLISFVAPATYSVISPTSTLVGALLRSENFEPTAAGVDAAEQRLFDSLQLPGFELAHSDLLQAAADGDVSAAAVFGKETQYYNTVVAIASMFDAVQSALPFGQLSTLVFEDLAAKISAPGSLLNLTIPSVVRSVMQGVAIRSGIDVDSNIADAVASVLAESNRVVDQQLPEGSLEFLEQVVQAHTFVQSDLVDDIEQLVRGNQSIASFVSSNSNVEAAIQSSPTYDVLPVYLAVEDVSVLEGSQGAPTVLAFAVTPIGSSVHPVSVDFITEDRTATAGEDYEPRTGRLEWAPGDQTSRTIDIAITGDDQFESNEAIALRLSRAVNATLIADEVHGFIDNDDAFVFESDTAEDDAFVLSVDNWSVILEQNGAPLLDTQAAQGVTLDISGQSADTLRLFTGAANQVQLHTDLAGNRMVTIGEHHVALDNQIELDSSATGGIDGLPELIFADTPLSLSAIAPSSLNAEELSVQWRVFAQGQSLAVRFGSSPTFDFIPEQGQTLIEMTVSDGVSTAVVSQSIHVYPPNVPPVANADEASSTENLASTTDVIANDVDLNPGDNLSLVAGSVAVRSATRDSDGQTISLVTATIQQDGNSVVFDPVSDFDFLAPGEFATVVIDYEVTDDNVAPLCDHGVLTITIDGVNDLPLLAAEELSLSVGEGMPATNAGTFSDLDEGDSITLSASAGTVTQNADGTWNWSQVMRDGPDSSGPVTITAIDRYQGVRQIFFGVTVTNRPPVPSMDNISTLRIEGTPIDVVASAADPAGADDTLTYSYEVFKDGAAIASASGSGVDQTVFSFTPADDGSFEIVLTVSDEDGGSAETRRTISVANVDPTADDVDVDLVENPSYGDRVTSVMATDPGDDQITYSIVGGSGAAAFAMDATSGAVTVRDPALVDFEATSRFTLQVEAADDDGGSDVAEVTVNLLNQPSISGVVFVDVNEDGIYQANEPGIDDVVIELRDSSGAVVLDSHDMAITALTSDGGIYLFEDLDPADYQLHERQPTGVADGAEILGSLGGVSVANDAMQLSLARVDAHDYAFAEIGGQVTSGESAGIGFWQNKHGQQLIAAAGNALSSWLTASFGNVFGDSLVGATGEQVADFYREQLFFQKGKRSNGPAKVDAQFMATALGVYFTNRNLAGDVGTAYGFSVSDTGLGVRVVNVGSRGAAFGVNDETNLTVMQLLQATNALTDVPDLLSGYASIYDVDGDGVIDAGEASLRSLANDLYNWINSQ